VWVDEEMRVSLAPLLWGVDVVLEGYPKACHVVLDVVLEGYASGCWC
jgi:hypothetical protein